MDRQTGRTNSIMLCEPSSMLKHSSANMMDTQWISEILLRKAPVSSTHGMPADRHRDRQTGKFYIAHMQAQTTDSMSDWQRTDNCRACIHKHQLVIVWRTALHCAAAAVDRIITLRCKETQHSLDEDWMTYDLNNETSHDRSYLTCNDEKPHQ